MVVMILTSVKNVSNGVPRGRGGSNTDTGAPRVQSVQRMLVTLKLNLNSRKINDDGQDYHITITCWNGIHTTHAKMDTVVVLTT